MPIPISNYVLITSAVGAGENVSTRNLGGLIITSNPLVPTNSLLTFTPAMGAAAVGEYFGTGSEEYARAEFYWSFISKNGTAPTNLNFWNWNNDAATGSLIFGVEGSYAPSQFTSIITGDMTLTLGGVTAHITGMNFGSDSTLAQVASTVQAAIRAAESGNPAWSGATVTYDVTTGQFNLVSGNTGADSIAVTAGSITDVAGPLGWLTGAILSNGTAAQTISANLNSLIQLSNNFGSLCFTYALAPTLATNTAAANWNNSLTPNIQFILSISVTKANASAWAAALGIIGGCCGTLVSPLATAFSEMEPMMVLAATNYSARNSVQNYMFQIFEDTPSVTDDTYATYDALLLNYYGNTQTAGVILSFFQRGVMWGIATQPSDLGVYANEIWFKDAIGAAIMTILLALAEIPANSTGRAIILSQIQSIINQALFNGTISVGKTLTNAQQLFITQVTGDPNAWLQVQNIGYWVDVTIQPYVVDGITEYKAVYTLIYSKNDVIRQVIGSDILI